MSEPPHKVWHEHRPIPSKAAGGAELFSSEDPYTESCFSKETKLLRLFHGDISAFSSLSHFSISCSWGYGRTEATVPGSDSRLFFLLLFTEPLFVVTADLNTCPRPRWYSFSYKAVPKSMDLFGFNHPFHCSALAVNALVQIVLVVLELSLLENW